MSVTPEYPKSRDELLLNEIAGRIYDTVPEEPQSRIEKWLAFLAENGIPGNVKIGEDVATVADLPAEGAVGEMHYVTAESLFYVWKITDGTGEWIPVGADFDPSDFARADGNYPEMTVGKSEYADVSEYSAYAEQLDSNQRLTVSSPFFFRPSGGGADVEGYLGSKAEISAIYGNTIVWNQLADANLARWLKTRVSVSSGEGVTTINVTSSSESALKYTQYPVDRGHKILVSLEVTDDSNEFIFGIYKSTESNVYDTRKSAYPGEAYSYFYNVANDERSFRITSRQSDVAGTTFKLKNLQLFDLTRMFGAGNEPVSVEAFRALFSLPYYDYDNSRILNFTGNGIKTVGFNALAPDGTARLLGGKAYEIVGAYTALSYSTGEEIVPADGIFTPTADGILTVIGADAETCVHLVWTGYRNGETASYLTETKDLPIGTYFPNGMMSAGTVRDELRADRSVKRCGVRAYLEGDEDDDSVATDGTNTVYALAEAVETPINPPLDLTFTSSDYGTELLLPENSSVPVTTPIHADILYTQNLRDKLQRLPNGVDTGDYYVHSDGTKQEYKPLPEKPAESGNYALHAEISGDNMTFSWQALVPQGNARHYTVRWNKTEAQMVRLNDAAHITTDITNFCHHGTVNANYSNPFDKIYPWSGRKLCNIDIDAYHALTAGESLTKCVSAWEGDPDFSYTDVDGVWVYTPEFWGKSWDEIVGSTEYRYFDVTDKPCGGYVHYQERIEGRWHGRTRTVSIDGTEKTCLIPSVGMPAKNIAFSTIHTYAKNFGATLDSIFSIDANNLLMIVEFATMNSQSAIGSGVDSMYHQSSDRIFEAATESTVVKVRKSAGEDFCIPEAIFDVGTANGGTQVGSYLVVSAVTDSEDSTLLDVTLNAPVTVTPSNFWSVHGISNTADADIGSQSGYIGTNGKSIAYYRGEELFGNLWFYTLGAYRQAGTQRVFIAHDDDEANESDELNASLHIDTGIVLSTVEGYVKKLGILSRSGLLCCPPFCTETGGDSSNPVGDSHYIKSSASNTVLLLGGGANRGTSDGAFYGHWDSDASVATWSAAARPRLKTP